MVTKLSRGDTTYATDYINCADPPDWAAMKGDSDISKSKHVLPADAGKGNARLCSGTTIGGRRTNPQRGMGASLLTLRRQWWRGGRQQGVMHCEDPTVPRPTRDEADQHPAIASRCGRGGPGGGQPTARRPGSARQEQVASAWRTVVCTAAFRPTATRRRAFRAFEWKAGIRVCGR